MKLQFSFKFVKTHGQGEIDSVRQFYRSRPIVKRNYPSLCVLSTSLSNHGLFPFCKWPIYRVGTVSRIEDLIEEKGEADEQIDVYVSL